MDFTRLTSIPLHEAHGAPDGEGAEVLREALAVLDAISFGELFSALPSNLADRARHQAGIVLLDLLSKRLKEALKIEEL